jgi:uncharacterized protein (TIGR00251 family)
VTGLDARPRDGGVRFSVRVQPRAASPGIDGMHGGALKVRRSAPPVDNAANESLAVLLAGELGVFRRSVRIVAGATARTKLVEVDSVDEARVRGLVTG